MKNLSLEKELNHSKRGATLISTLVTLVLASIVFYHGALIVLESQKQIAKASIRSDLSNFHSNTTTTFQSNDILQHLRDAIEDDSDLQDCFQSTGTECDTIYNDASPSIFAGVGTNFLDDFNRYYRVNGEACPKNSGEWNVHENDLCIINRTADFAFTCPSDTKCTGITVVVKTAYEDKWIPNTEMSTTYRYSKYLLVDSINQLRLDCGGDSPMRGINFDDSLTACPEESHDRNCTGSSDDGRIAKLAGSGECVSIVEKDCTDNKYGIDSFQVESQDCRSDLVFN